MGALVGASATTAKADVDPYPNTTDVDYAGFSDPFAAYEAGALTPTDDANLALKLQGLDADALLTEIGAVADSSQVDYATARAAYAAMQGGLEPDILALMAGAGEGGALPLLAGTGVGLGVLAVAGLVAYHYHWGPFGGGATHEVYVTFDRAKIGGAAVTIPASPVTLGTDYFAKPTFGWTAWCSMATAASGGHCNGLTNYNAAGCHDSPVCLMFNYSMIKQRYHSDPDRYGTDPSDYDSNFISHYGSEALPRYDTCSFQISTCYGTKPGTDDWAVGGPGLVGDPTTTAALAAAADTTLHNLTDPDQVGVFVPGASLDNDLYASGHLLEVTGATSQLKYCGAAAEAPAIDYTCEGAYIPSYKLDELLPRTQTPTLPGGATERGSTTTFTGSDPSAGPTRTGVTGATTDDCGRAMINYLLAPHAFAYYGCEPAAQDPEAGPTVPIPEPPAPGEITLPYCAGLYYSECVALLRNAGLLGTITRVLGDPGVDGDPLRDPDMVQQMTPNPGTNVAVGSSVALRVYATETGEDPAPTEGPSPSQCGTSANPCVTVDGTPDPTVGNGDAPAVPAIVWPVVPDLSGKWPFGMPGWVHDQLSGIVDGGDCPEWDWHIVTFGSTFHLPISMCFLNPYMPALRALLLILSTLTLLWGMAAAVLGLSNLVASNDTIIDLSSEES